MRIYPRVYSRDTQGIPQGIPELPSAIFEEVLAGGHIQIFTHIHIYIYIYTKHSQECVKSYNTCAWTPNSLSIYVAQPEGTSIVDGWPARATRQQCGFTLKLHLQRLKHLHSDSQSHSESFSYQKLVLLTGGPRGPPVNNAAVFKKQHLKRLKHLKSDSQSHSESF